MNSERMPTESDLGGMTPEPACRRRAADGAVRNRSTVLVLGCRLEPIPGADAVRVEPDARPPRRPASPDCRLAVAGFVVGGCAVYLAMVAGGVL